MALNIKDKAGLTPLMRASHQGQVGVVRSLLAHDEVQVDLPDGKGSQAIHYASAKGHVEVIQLLLDHGADPNIPDKDGDSPLNLVCMLFPRISDAGSGQGSGKLAEGLAGLETLAKDSGPLGRLVADLQKQLGTLGNSGELGQLGRSGKGDKHSEDKTEVALSCMTLLLDRGASVNLACNKGMTPLLNMCFRRTPPAAAHALISRGASMDDKDQDTHTPLILAAYTGQVDLCQVLIDGGAQVDIPDQRGSTPLWFAAQNGHHACVEFLLGKGADATLASDKGATPLIIACKDGHTECVKLLLAALPHTPEHLEAQIVLGVTALLLANMNNHPDIVELLIKSGANVESLDAEGDPSLIYACSQGYDACVTILLRHNANPDVAGKGGGTSVYKASQNGHSKCLTLLTQAGADVNIPRDNGTVPLQVAIENNRNECVKILVMNNAELEIRDRRGLTVLGVASLRGNLDCVEMLIQAGASVDAQDNNGMTPLHLSAMEGHDKCVSALLQAGADQNVQNHAGSTPLNIAVEKNKGASVEALLAGHTASGGKGNSGGGGTGATTGMKRREPGVKASKKESITITPLINIEAARGSSPTETPDHSHVHDIARAFVKDLNLSNAYFDPKFDVCFCESCHNQRGDNLRYTRGKPPMGYGLPIGWCKFGLRTKPQAEAERIFEEWHMAFHGTRVMNLGKILQTGDLLLPGDYTPGGDELKIPDNHWDPDHKNPNMKPPKGHNVKKFYFSPSIKYSGHDVYAPKWGWRDSSTGHKHTLRVAFQVRIKPQSYDITRETIGARQEMDPLFSNSELEWSTERRGVAILVGLLVKVEGSMQDAPVEDIRQIMGSEVPSTQENFLDDEPGPAVMTSEFRYRTRGGHIINLRAGDAVLRLSTSGTDSVIVHPKVDGDVTVPSSILRPT